MHAPSFQRPSGTFRNRCSYQRMTHTQCPGPPGCRVKSRCSISPFTHFPLTLQKPPPRLFFRLRSDPHETRRLATSWTLGFHFTATQCPQPMWIKLCKLTLRLGLIRKVQHNQVRVQNNHRVQRSRGVEVLLVSCDTLAANRRLPVQPKQQPASTGSTQAARMQSWRE